MLKRIIFISICLFATAPIACACRCWTPTTVRGGANAVNTVMLVRVESIELWPEVTNPELFRGINFVVEKVYKGDAKAGDKAVLANTTRTAQGMYGFNTCHRTLGKEYVGKKLLYYGDKPSAGADWFAYTCSRTALAEARADDIAWLDKMDSVAGKSRISGRAVFSNDSADKGTGIVRDGIRGMRIVIKGDDKTYEAVTDADGVYEIYDLPPGIYTVKPLMREKYDLTGVRRFYDLGPKKDRTQEELKAANALVEIIGPESIELTLKDGQPVHLFPGGHTVIDFYYQENKQTAWLLPPTGDHVYRINRSAR